ncbi:MAG TPA: M56 family metallopeptidase [Nocardioides sp.]|jgi:Zn-dependent protease with chaperone function
MTAFTLALLAVVLAGPVPEAMADRAALRRTPWATMLLWQGVALAAVLSALGAGLALVTDRAWRGEPDAVGLAVAAVALLVTGLVSVRLLLSGHRVGTSLRSLRRRHRRQVDLVAREERGVAVLEYDAPLAYCLPGLAKARVVVSRGALGRLDTDEVAAVIAHERAHLRARHDLVLEAFSVLHQAFPRWVSSRAALTEVGLLVEVLADRAAVRSVGARPLARALVALADREAPEAMLGAGGSALTERVRLLADTDPHPLQGALVGLAAVGVVVLPTAFVAVPWLAGLAAA